MCSCAAESACATTRSGRTATSMARIRRVYACAVALTSVAALAPALDRRQALSSGAAAALAAAAPAWAADSSAAIAVERSGFAPTIKQTGRTSRYECGRGVRRGAFINRRVEDRAGETHFDGRVHAGIRSSARAGARPPSRSRSIIPRRGRPSRTASTSSTATAARSRPWLPRRSPCSVVRRRRVDGVNRPFHTGRLQRLA